MQPRRILLVDDEPSVLEGLRRRFRSLRREWEVVTAPEGHAALAVLETQLVDAIVTDMRMPKMSGEVLLERVRALQPHALRILLSGQLDAENATLTTPLAEHCLSKPCDASEIVRIIELPRQAVTQ